MNNITFIRAGAGSGKTYHVTELIELELRAKRLDPAGLVATTFTTKAAEELRQRLQSRLYGAGLVVEAERMGEALLGTVHSIAAQLLERFAFEAGISPRLKVLAEDESARLLAQAVDAESKFEEVVALQALGDRLAQVDDETGSHLWPGQVDAIIEAARANDISPEQLPGFAEQSCIEFLRTFGPVTTEKLDTLLIQEIDRTRPGLETLPKAAKVTTDYLLQMRKVREQIADKRPVWKDWLPLFDPEKGPGKRDGATKLTTGVAAVASRLLEHPQLQADVREYTTHLFAIAQRSFAGFRHLKEERGMVDFADLEALAYDLIRSNQVARDHLKRTISLLVVDEFQDTSPLQLALFLELARCARKVIWVGDVKQAIYGFRNSDPELVDATVTHLAQTGGLGKTLATNYRSVPALLDLTNELFSPAFKKSLGLAREEVALQAHRSNLSVTGPAVEIFHLKFEGRLTNAKIAGALVEGVVSLLGKNPSVKVLDPATNTERNLRAGDIGILTRTNDHGKDLVQALAQRGITASLSGSGLLATPEAMLALSCLRCLADPQDRLAITELIALKGDFEARNWLERRLRYVGSKVEKQPDRWGLDGDTKDSRVVALHAAQPQLAWLSVAEALDLALELGEVCQTVTAWGPDPARAAQRRANVEMLRVMAGQYEETSASSLAPATIAGFLHWCGEQEAAGEDKKAWAEGADAVQILTYHKAKGLEWPVVICADLDTEPRPRWFSVRVVSEEGKPLSLAAPLANRRIAFWANPFGSKSKRNPLLDRMVEDQAGKRELERSQNEDLRLLYVGFTRARDRLVLVQKAIDPEKAKKEEGATATWLDALGCPLPASDATEWHVSKSVSIPILSHFLSPPETLPLPSGTRGFWFPNSLPRTPKLPARITPFAEPPRESAVAEEIIAFGQRLDVLGDPEDTILGDALHAILAAEIQHPDHPDALRLAERVLRGFGLDRNVKAQEASRMAHCFHEEIQQRFQPKSLMVECPFHYSQPNGQLVTGFMDLVLETENGWVVIDHKSYRGGKKEWRAKALTYSGQLAAYAPVIAATGRRCAGTWIHFATGGGLVRVVVPVAEVASVTSLHRSNSVADSR